MLFRSQWLARDDVALIAQNDAAFKHHLDRYKYPQRHDSDPMEHREKGLAILASLNARLIEQGGQLAGAQRGLVDMAIMPFVRQFSAVDTDWFAGLDLQPLQGWLTDHVGSLLFASAMQRWTPWKEGDQPVVFAP